MILFYKMNLICFVDLWNSLLLIFCSFNFILSLFKKNAFDKTLLFLRNDSNLKYFSSFVFNFSVSNKISSTPMQLLNFQEFSNSLFIPTPNAHPTYLV